MEREFLASFRSYVSGEDIRRQMLRSLLQIPPVRIVEEELIEVHDFAALMTCCIFLDSKNSAGEKLFLSYRQYVQEREEAEDTFVDPDEIPFNPNLQDVEIVLDSALPELKTFLETLSRVESGRIYLAKIIVCLVHAQSIPQIIPNLWK